jgi:cytochrome c oxidase subunit IV
VITIAEVIMGMFFSHSMPKALVAFFFLGLTLLKAGYIVSVFMHLGDELKNFMIAVLIPLTLFIWFIIAFLYDGGFWLERNSSAPNRNHPTQVEVHS